MSSRLFRFRDFIRGYVVALYLTTNLKHTDISVFLLVWHLDKSSTFCLLCLLKLLSTTLHLALFLYDLSERQYVALQLHARSVIWTQFCEKSQKCLTMMYPVPEESISFLEVACLTWPMFDVQVTRGQQSKWAGMLLRNVLCPYLSPSSSLPSLRSGQKIMFSQFAHIMWRKAVLQHFSL